MNFRYSLILFALCLFLNSGNVRNLVVDSDDQFFSEQAWSIESGTDNNYDLNDQTAVVQDSSPLLLVAFNQTVCLSLHAKYNSQNCEYYNIRAPPA